MDQIEKEEPEAFSVLKGMYIYIELTRNYFFSIQFWADKNRTT